MKLEEILGKVKSEDWTRDRRRVISPTIRTIRGVEEVAQTYTQLNARLRFAAGEDTKVIRQDTIDIKGCVPHEQRHVATLPNLSTSGVRIAFKYAEDRCSIRALGIISNTPITSPEEIAILVCAPEAFRPEDRMSPGDRRTFNTALDELQTKYPAKDRAELEKWVKEEARKRVQTAFIREDIEF